jgi:hypothetical protein
MRAFWPAKEETKAHGLGFGLGHVNRSASSAGSAHGWVDVIFEVMDTCDCAWMGEACRKAEIKN